MSLWSCASDQLTDVFGPCCDGPTQLRDKLLGVQSDLDDVVQQGEGGSEGERRHEQRDETKLDDWKGERTYDDNKMYGAWSYVLYL